MGAEQIYQARWVALKKIVDDHRKAASERMELEHPMLDDIYRAMLNLELAGPYPMPKSPPGIDAGKPLSIGMEAKGRPPRPPIVCLCGSTRFMDNFRGVELQFTLDGEIVLSVAVCKTAQHHNAFGAEEMRHVDELHLRKIDLADRVFFLNVGGYIGDSTCRELAYALGTGKRVAFLESEAGEKFIRENTGRIDGLIKELGVEGW